MGIVYIRWIVGVAGMRCKYPKLYFSTFMKDPQTTERLRLTSTVLNFISSINYEYNSFSIKNQDFLK